jgi:hypothetical protein
MKKCPPRRKAYFSRRTDMSTDVAAQHESGLMESAGGAMQTAVQAARDGAADARARVAETLPAVTGFISRLVYTTSYTLSYGVVFPTMLVVSVVPKENAIVHGLVDGGRAAKDTVANMRGVSLSDQIGAALNSAAGDNHGADGDMPS